MLKQINFLPFFTDGESPFPTPSPVSRGHRPLHQVSGAPNSIQGTFDGLRDILVPSSKAGHPSAHLKKGHRILESDTLSNHKEGDHQNTPDEGTARENSSNDLPAEDPSFALQPSPVAGSRNSSQTKSEMNRNFKKGRGNYFNYSFMQFNDLTVL